MMLARTHTLRSLNKHVSRASFATAPKKYAESRPDGGGPGGRSSNPGITVAVFGAGGFLGRYVCSNLGEIGSRTYIGNRGDEFELRHLRPMFDLGRSRFVFYSARDRDSMAEVIADADVVVNLIGKYYETKTLSDKPSFPYIDYKTNFSFEETNVEIAKTIAELCTEMQVDNLIHVSSLAASPDSKSEWARTKYAGECAVKEAYPWATIIRPTQLFGYEDKLLNQFANQAAMAPFGYVPMIDGGQALTQPVFMDDVANVITKVVGNAEGYEGKTIDCFGSRDFTYKELAEFVYDITSQYPELIDVPKSVMLNIAKITQFQPNPMMTPDLVELWSEDYVAKSPEWYESQVGADKVLTMADLGVEATPIEKIAFRYLHRFRKGGHFVLAEGYHGIHQEKKCDIFE
mmetsp:Transcript_2869/g.4531  ORF Transcript_2869/g.4531 Transcript_2869/m.4531 type:complete len:403 (-) Transcript_2869:82-1290(-)